MELRKESLSRHLKTHQNTLFNCSECKKKFKSEGGLESHIKTHLLKTCTLCDETFRRPFLLRKHMQAVHVHTARKISKKVDNKTCDDCGSIFNRPWRLLKHKNLVHGKKTETIKWSCKCKHCDVFVQTDRELKVHLQENHSDLSFKCEIEICNKMFFTKKAFRKHIKYHIQTNEKDIAEEVPVEKDIDDEVPVVVPEKVRNLVSIQVNKRIKQKIKLGDFDNTSDDDTSYAPPKGILTHLTCSFVRSVIFTFFFFVGTKIGSAEEVIVTRGQVFSRLGYIEDLDNASAELEGS